MALAAASLWLIVAAPVLLQTSGSSVPCPVTKVAFAPPLDRPMQVTRVILRSLIHAEFRQTVTYRIHFTRAGRGYRMHWQQTGHSAEGPPELLRLLALQEESAQGETLDFTLDENGALLGVTEAPDAAQRLAEALDRLRKDPALASRPPREQANVGQMLDRIATLQPAERAELHLAKAARLLVGAGRDCTASTITGHDGTDYQVEEPTNADGSIRLVSTTQDQRTDGSTMHVSTKVAVSPQTGLASSNWRSTHTTASGVARNNEDVLTLESEP